MNINQVPPCIVYFNAMGTWSQPPGPGLFDRFHIDGFAEFGRPARTLGDSRSLTSVSTRQLLVRRSPHETGLVLKDIGKNTCNLEQWQGDNKPGKLLRRDPDGLFHLLEGATYHCVLKLADGGRLTWAHLHVLSPIEKERIVEWHDSGGPEQPYDHFKRPVLLRTHVGGSPYSGSSF
jgi:hypothetical protein